MPVVRFRAPNGIHKRIPITLRISMAIPLSKLSLLSHPLAKQPWRGSITQPLPLMLPARGSPAPARESGVRMTKQRCKVAAGKDDSMASIITELEREQVETGEEVLAKGQFQPDASLAKRWREIHGRDDWGGLLDPMDPLLRSELIRYGEFAQACYDAYDYDPYSRYSGSCRYGRRDFFSSLGMEGYGYEVTHYLYATSNIKLPNFFTRSRGSRAWSERATWIGFVAVSGDEATARLGRRDIVVAWRGTVTKLEWVADLMDFLRPVASEGIPCPDPDVKVESGFVDLYTDKDPTCRFCKYSAREQVLAEVRKLVHKYVGAGEDVSLSFSGHSLGSALATLSAYDVVESGLNASAGPDGTTKVVPVCVFSFSGPRVGNRAFKDRFEGLGVKALRVLNVHDSVPKVPGIFFNEDIPAFLQKLAEAVGLPWSYSHVGAELALDHKHSPFLSDTLDPSCFHNLEAHLHLLDGYHGKGQRFALSSGRDPALVNKAADFLKDHLHVPPQWRQDENKGMIMSGDGRWMQAERQRIDDHAADMHHHLRELGSSGDDKLNLSSGN